MLCFEQGNILGMSLAGECSFKINSSDAEQFGRMFDLRAKVAELVSMHVGAVTLFSEGQVAEDTSPFDAKALPTVRLSATMDAHLSSVWKWQNAIQRQRQHALQRDHAKLRLRSQTFEQKVHTHMSKHNAQVSDIVAKFDFLNKFRRFESQEQETASWTEALVAYQRHSESFPTDGIDVVPCQLHPDMDLNECSAILYQGFRKHYEIKDRFYMWIQSLHDLYWPLVSLWRHEFNFWCRHQQRRLGGWNRRKQCVPSEFKADREQKRLMDLRKAKEQRRRKLDTKTRISERFSTCRDKRVSRSGRSASGRYGGFVFVGDSLDLLDRLSL
jgi:hypothetical protein